MIGICRRFIFGVTTIMLFVLISIQSAAEDCETRKLEKEKDTTADLSQTSEAHLQSDCPMSCILGSGVMKTDIHTMMIFSRLSAFDIL